MERAWTGRAALLHILDRIVAGRRGRRGRDVHTLPDQRWTCGAGIRRGVADTRGAQPVRDSPSHRQAPETARVTPGRGAPTETAAWIRPDSWEYVRRLKETERLAIYLRLAEDRSFADIARLLGKSEGAASRVRTRVLASQSTHKSPALRRSWRVAGSFAAAAAVIVVAALLLAPRMETAAFARDRAVEALMLEVAGRNRTAS